MAKRKRLAQVEQAVQQHFSELGDVADAAATSPGTYRTYTPPVDLEHATEQSPGNLRTEIAVVRTVIAAAKMDLVPAQRALIISQLMSALVRLMRENRFVDGTPADQIDQVMVEVLHDQDVGMAAARTDTMPIDGGPSGSNNR